MEVESHGRSARAITRGRPARSVRISTSFHAPSISLTASPKVVADFHHQPAAGLEQPLGFRNQAAIDLQAVVAAVQRELGLVIADFALQRGLVARGNVGRIRDHQIEAAAPKQRCQIAGDPVDSRAEPAAIRRGDAQSGERNIRAEHASSGFERQRDRDRARSGADVDDVPRAQLRARLR